MSTLPPLPETRVEPVTDVLHGVPIVDPYRWLEDQQSPDTRTWLGAQNAYCRAWLDPLPERPLLRDRLARLMRVDSMSAPSVRGDRYFLYKHAADQELTVVYVRDGLDGEDRVLLDPHTMSDDLSVNVGLMGLSDDGRLVAWAKRFGGEDEVEIHFLDVDTGAALPLVLPKDRYGGISFVPDASGFYYSIYGGDKPRVYYRSIDADAAPVEVFGEGYGEGVLIGAGVSENGRWLVIHVFYGSAAKKTEVYVKDLSVDGPVQPVVRDVEARFYGAVGDDDLYLTTNWEAPRSRVIRVGLTNLDRAAWVEIIPEQAAVLEGVSLVGGKLACLYLENVISRLELRAPDGTLERTITGPTIGSLGGMSGRWSHDEAFYAFTSYHMPTTIYRYGLQSGESSVWWKADVPVDTDALEVRQVWYESKDGTRVPMFVCHRRGLEPDGRRPVYLTGYGGFMGTATPGFSAVAALWASLGGIFAHPALRGGGEFGEAWHEAGMLANKQNVFDDFIAAAEHLIAEGWTNPERIAISGGSNGGLLVGAALTQRPELYRAVVCTYPLLDMVRYHQFLVAHFWVPEYGSSEDPEQFEYLRAYSPYHRVVEGTEYPAVLFMTGDGDTRVDPLHARKMAALLQAATGSTRPVLLHYDFKAGHSGGKPMSQIVDDAADSLSFLMHEVGLAVD